MGVICDRKMLLKLEEKFTAQTTRLIILYETECWVRTSQQEHELNVLEMRMLHWMSRHTRQDQIKNKCIIEKVGVTFIVDRMVESHFRWLGHAGKGCVEATLEE